MGGKWLLRLRMFFSVFLLREFRIQRHKIYVLFVTLFLCFSPDLHAHFSYLESPFHCECVCVCERVRFAVMLCVHCIVQLFFYKFILLVPVCLPIFSPDAIRFDKKRKTKNIYQAFRNNPLFRLFHFSFSVGVFLFSCLFIFFACFLFDLMFAFG